MSQENGEQPLGLRARLSQNIEMARKGYEQLVHAIIRPPRANYVPDQLGPSEFTFLGQRFHREDVELDTGRENKSPNAREGDVLKMQASVWTRKAKDGSEDMTEIDATHPQKTFIVYLHGNASARVEVLPQLSFLLASGIYGVCSLDFTGSGLSDGDYVSLGYFERYDLDVVLAFLQQRYGDSLEVVLWGRSMGASTALMHASKKTKNGDSDIPAAQPDSTNSLLDIADNPLKGLICDSPFASLPQLCEELVEKARQQGIVVPGVIVSVAIAMIARSVRNLAHFSIHEISPLKHVPSIDTPALFICGGDDDFIPPHHSEDLCAAYQQGVSTNLLMVPGGHNDARPQLVFEAVAQFLQYRLSLNDDMALTVPDHLKNRYHQVPPWVYSSQPHIFVAHKNEANKITAVAATSASVQAESLGMTQERQDDIQNKLQNMFGQGQTQTSQREPTPSTSNGINGVQSPSRDREEMVAKEEAASMEEPVVAAGVPLNSDDFDTGAE